ncbi:MAG: hypothetical protein Alpg2KO_07720 [Alphaproteobacteria bacterium]
MFTKVDKVKVGHRGASLLGYALLVGLISVVGLSAIQTTGTSVSGLFDTVGQDMAAVSGNGSGGSGAGGSASPTPTPPALGTGIVDWHGSVLMGIDYMFDAGAFAGDSLSYSATLTNGDPLPGWLSFDSAQRRFSGTADFTDAGVFNIRVTASNAGGSQTEDFTLTVEGLLIGSNVATVSSPDTFRCGLNSITSVGCEVAWRIPDGGPYTLAQVQFEANSLRVTSNCWDSRFDHFVVFGNSNTTWSGGVPFLQLGRSHSSTNNSNFRLFDGSGNFQDFGVSFQFDVSRKRMDFTYSTSNQSGTITDLDQSASWTGSHAETLPNLQSGDYIIIRPSLPTASCALPTNENGEVQILSITVAP